MTYSMLLIRSPRNSYPVEPGMLWQPAEGCWIDGSTIFGPIYLKVYVPADEATVRVHPARRLEPRVVAAMLHEGNWYWIVESPGGRAGGRG